MSIDYDRACFVVMPFGTKCVGAHPVDFDAIYHRIFEPAVRATPLPGGSGCLEPRRADQDRFAADIGCEMFQYLEYSRIALVDVSGLNCNVMYELGTRHRARATGTVIVRQTGAPLPFDFDKIRAFSYDAEPEARAEESRQLITTVLGESLEQGAIDSPYLVALAAQRGQGAPLEKVLCDAENALRMGDKAMAVERLRRAVQEHPGNPMIRMKLGLLLRDRGQWEEALAHFDRAAALDPCHAEAFREKGIAENKLKRDGEASLRRAIEIDPRDFDALASLGGVYKRAGRWDEALEMYRRSREVSHGHPYPLLNEITLEARCTGALALDDRRAIDLDRAERSLTAQVVNEPPYNPPWSFFDLAQIRLFRGDRAGFVARLDQGAALSEAWQVKTFRETLQLLADGGADLPGLAEGIAELDRWIARLR